MVHGLQTQVQNYKLYITKESLYNQRMQYERLQRRLQEAESWLQKLGFLALLVNFLICQTLVSVMQEELTTFVSCTMKVLSPRQLAVRPFLLPLPPKRGATGWLVLQGGSWGTA